MKTLLLQLMILLIVNISGLSQTVQSNFTDTTDGWTCEGDVSPNPQYIATGGNPGGYISNTDFGTGDVWYWIAPAKFLGNQASKYGKTLRYDLKQSTTNTYTADDIIIEGSGLRLLYRANYQPITAWTTFAISLTESSGWYLDTAGNPAPTKAQMQSVLSNITKLTIRAEYSENKDIDGLDNVIFGQPKYYSGSGSACFFDGINNYISLGSSNLLKPTTQLTVQCWALFKDLKEDYRLVSNTNTGGYNISYSASDSTIHFFTRVNGNYISAIGQKPVPNSWHHYALTYDGRFLKGYIDGILQQSVDAGSNYPITYSGTNSTLIGAEAGSADVPDGSYLNGYVDEVSFWNKALTQSQIRNWMCRKIKPGHPAYSGLLAYYKFDEEKSDVKLYDQKLAIPGTLRNGAVFELSGAPIGDTSSNVYNSKTIFLKHPDGDSLNVQITTGNPAGIHIYRVDQSPSIIKGTKGAGPNDRYFGVFHINDTSTVYKVVYGYEGNPYVTTSAEPSLKLYKRNNNADTIWRGLNATLNSSTKTLTATGQKTEYILGATDTALHKKSTVSVSDIVVVEGNSSSKLVKFILQLDAPMNGTSFINFITQDSTATVANNDYMSTSGTAKFEPASLKDTVQVRIYGDTNVEPNEFFKLLLSNPVNIMFTDSSATCKINNDDAATLLNTSSLKDNLKIVVPSLVSRKEVWRIQGINDSKADILLFDETGRKVFQQNNYKNEAVLYNLNPGTYFYKLIIKNTYNKPQEYTGKIVLIE